MPEWVSATRGIAEKIVKEQSSQTLLALREQFMELIISNVPGFAIISNICDELLGRNISPEAKRAVVKYCVLYDVRMSMGGKDLIHLEALAARLMVIMYKVKNNIAL